MPRKYREELDRTAASDLHAILLVTCALLCASAPGCGSVRGTDAPLMQQDPPPSAATGEPDAR